MATIGSFPIDFNRSPNALYYDYALQAAWLAGSQWIPDPDYALHNDPVIYEKANRDPVIGHAVEQRLHDVAGREIFVVPRSQRPEDVLKAQIHSEMLEEIGLTTMSTYQLAKFAFQGAAYQFMEGRRQWAPLGNKAPEHWWMPRRLRDVGWRRIRYATDFEAEQDAAGEPTGKKKRAVWMELFSIDGQQFKRVNDTSRFVRALYDDAEAGLNYGLGMMAALSHYFYFKEQVLAYGLQWLERWALGLVVAKIDASAPGAADLNNKKTRDAYLNVLKAMASRHQIAIDKRDEIEVVQNGADGYRAALEFVEYFDNAMVRRILSARLTTGGGAGEGSLSRAEVEQDSSQTLIGYDRKLLFEYLTRDLGGAIERMNAPQFASLGLSRAKPPRYHPEPIERDNPTEAADIVTKLGPMGVPFKRSEVYEKTGFSMPSANDDVLILQGPQNPNASAGTAGLPDLHGLRELPNLEELLGAN